MPSELEVGTGMSADRPPCTAGPVIVGVLDETLHVEAISTSVRTVLGHAPSDCIGSVALGAVHPDDLTAALLGVVEAIDSDSSVHLRVRLRSRDPLWTRVRLAVAPLGCAARSRLGFVASPEPEPEQAGMAEAYRLATLEALVRRVATEMRAVATASPGRATEAAAALQEANLTSRETQVLGLLLGGKRVSAIARSMFVSQSTVRNHLCAIYRKLHVHSQEELLELLRPSGGSVVHGAFPVAGPRPAQAAPRYADPQGREVPRWGAPADGAEHQ